MTVIVLLEGGLRVEAIVDTAATSSVVSPRLAKKIGMRKRETKVKVQQADGRLLLGGNKVVNTNFSVLSKSPQSQSKLPKRRTFQYNAEVLQMGHRDMILGLSWLEENEFWVDTVGRKLWRQSDGFEIICRERKIPSVTILKVEEFFQSLKEQEVIMILDITERYAEYAKVWSSEQANRLPPHSEFDHDITFKDPNTKPPNGPIYKTTWEEEEALRAYIQEHEPVGKIRRSSSSAGSPILFTRKANGTLRLCVDYRGINRLVTPNRYPLPLMDELRDKTTGSTWFTRLDLKNGYYLIRIKEGDEWKTAFKTKLGLYEYTVMPFGLANAPASFQAMMDKVLQGLHDIEVHYIDDILIHTKGSLEEHYKAVESVLRRLVNNNLAVNLAKSEFHVHETVFLGLIVNGKETKMNPAKLDVIKDWPTPQNKRQAQAFLGFANYYRRFIRDYSKKTRCLTSLTGNVPFTWEAEQEAAFQGLKESFLTAGILKNFDRRLPTRVETDASNQSIAGCLLQKHADNEWHTVDFHSRTLNSIERNWPIHDKELWAIVSSLSHWRSWLAGADNEFEVHTDHQGLQYFFTKQRLNSRQAHWGQKLAEFNFKVAYKPGSAMGRVDSITRRTGQEEAGGYEQLLQNKEREIPVNRDEKHILVLNGEIELDLIEEVDISSWDKKDGLWVVPPQYKQTVLRQYHDSKIAGHWGRERTLELISRNFIWDGRHEDVARYVASCKHCQKAKADRHAKRTKLQPMPTGILPFQEIAIDFVGELPESEGFNAILVITDRFTKMQLYIPAKTTWTSEDVANAYLCEVWKFFGLPLNVTSDRGPQFASAFTKALNKKLDISLRLSTAHHPQTDGLSERAIQTLKQFLRIYCHDRQTRWVRWLPLAQFTYNSTTTSTHGFTPFTAAYGWNPRSIRVNDEEINNPAAEDWLDRLSKVHAEIAESLREINKSRITRSVNKARMFAIGDLVLVDRRNLTLKAGNNRSLSNKYIGPFRILDRKGHYAYKLDIPKRMKLHNVIHVSLLKPFMQREGVQENTLDADDDHYYTVEKIVDSKQFPSGIKYLIKWEGYGEDENTWEPIDYLLTDSIKGLLIDFHKTNIRKPVHPSIEPLI